jgi:hypothetical protein
MSDFYPVSPIIGITNTSYGAQAGVMDEKWAVRVLRGKKIITEKPIHELDLDSFVGVVYGHIRVEGISRHTVAQCAGRMMQYARKFQTSGVAPDYEVTDLVREGEDGELITNKSADNGLPIADTSAAYIPTQEADVDTRIGEFPDFTALNQKQAWKSSIEAQAALIARMATYGAALPEGHLGLMFGQAADEIVYQWGRSSDLHNPLLKFAELILGCTEEGQLPKTGTDKVTLDTSTCELLKKFKEMDPDGSRFPAGYPCAFHEMIAERVGQRVGAEINLNTSSIGCRVTFRLKL